MMTIHCRPGELWVEDQEDIERLQKAGVGSLREGKLWLTIEEALYLVAFQNATCQEGDQRLGFGELAARFPEKRLFVRYNAYRDWKDRGLVVERVRSVQGKQQANLKRYPTRGLRPEKLAATATWFPDDLFAVIEDEAVGRQLFQGLWIGQYGIYKQDRGSLLTLDFMETALLAKHFHLPVVDVRTGKKLKHGDLIRQAEKRRPYATQLYEVYEDWRLQGYVVKSGFKFGSHFRIYFPGAAPGKLDYTHSKHVLHVFPKQERLLVSEWSRAVRVAHGVRKTFLLGIPELKDEDYQEAAADFLAYRRKNVGGNWVRETTGDRPRYLMAALSEEEHIGGLELASLLKRANDLGLELLLSITDRETAITYYVLKQVELPGSRFAYYEIEWMKP
ncbi:MAG: tRNA-intron lyase [Candidatus Aenigmarchaeota archaeon]|nr:tRNA-intron lyase [Candidatus Aenigmarchaeota archaeon]